MKLSFYRKLKLLIPLLIVFGFQNCQVGLKNGNIEDITNSLKSNNNGGGGISGNGQGYEGKLQAYERQLPNDVFFTSAVTSDLTENRCNDTILEIISLDGNSFVLDKLDTYSCQRKKEIINESELNYSKNQMILSHNDGLFLGSKLLSDHYADFQPQIWCQSEIIQNQVFDLLILNNKQNGSLKAVMTSYDINTSAIKNMDDFNLNFNFTTNTNKTNSFNNETKDLFYSNDSLQLKIFTSIPKDLKKGNYSAQSLFSVDQVLYNPNMSCYLGHKYDGALWPSRPLVSEKLGFRSIQINNNIVNVTNSAQLFYYSSVNKNILFSSENDLTKIFNYDLKTNIKSSIQVKELTGFDISSTKLSLDATKLLVRTASLPNMFFIIDINTKSVVYRSASNIQVTEYGDSSLGIWFKGREFDSILVDQSLRYSTPENNYYPFSQKISGLDVKLPEHDKFINFNWIETNQDRSFSLFEVTLGQSASIINKKWISDMKTSMDCDLAIYNHSNNLLYPLKIANRLNGFNLGASTKNQSVILDNKVYAVVSNKSVLKLIKLNLINEEITTLLEIPKIVDTSTNNLKNIYQLSNHKFIYLDNRNMFQVIDLETESSTPLLPAILIGNEPVRPSISKNYLMYFVYSQDGSLNPFIWDLTRPINQGPIFQYKKSNLKYQMTSNPVAKGFDFDVNKNGKLILNIDLNFDNSYELYYADLQNNLDGFRMISNRYVEYGGVTKFFVYNDDQIFLISENNSVNYLFQWSPR